MSRARVAIDTAVLASSVRVDTGVEPDIGAVVIRNYRVSRVPEELGPRARRFILRRLSVGDIGQVLEPVRRIACGAPAAKLSIFWN